MKNLNSCFMIFDIQVWKLLYVVKRCTKYLYSELSKKDKRTFDETAIAIADLRNLSKKDTLRVFLLLNRGGKVVSNAVLDHAKELLNEME